MELVLDLVVGVIYFLFGALVGVLYPAKSRGWARWQWCGVALGLMALLAFSLAAIVAWMTDGSPVVWPAVLIGLACLTGYAIVGNVCRKFHEGQESSSRDSPQSSQRVGP